MTILNNIYRCRNCGLHAIAEEKDSHVCLEVKETRFHDDIKLVFDGKTWYPLKLRTTTNQQPERTTKDSTEPKIRFCGI